MCNLSKGVREAGIQEGTIVTLANIVNNGLLSIETVSEQAKMTVDEFKNKAKEFGISLKK